jgi:uncharacterized protein (DUF1786 family)
MSPRTSRTFLGSLAARLGGGRGRRGVEATLGRGLWRRLHDDCSTALRDASERAELMPAVRALAQDAQQRWPSDSLDVPADPAGRSAYVRLADVRRALREAAYRERLLAAGEAVPAQQQLRARALETARTLVAEPDGPE